MTIAGGYSFLRDLGSGGTPSTDYPTGAFAAVTRQFGPRRMALVGDVSMHARENRAIEVIRLRALLGGARVDVLSIWNARLFAQALAGIERFSEPGFSETGTAFQPGAGIDLAIWRRLGARVQADYRIVRAEGTTFRSLRVNAGATVAF